jgi:serine/threonine protein kinase
MTTLGRYQIIEKLGAGSMGIVYRARDANLEREVALKTIRTGTEVDSELRERFYREARACARLQHPGIVAVHDLGEADRTAFIAMELLVGSDFRKLIDQRVEIPLPAKVDAMAQVCEALAHAHRHGIIHRDVKPSNLFLVEGRRAKVLDFGIARLPSSHLTVAGRILGTPNYMAPEQILGKPTDTRSDLFSAAVLFFEWLVYAHPFQSDLIPKRIAEGRPDSLFDHDPKLPIILEKILARAMAADPEQRYQSGDEFGGDLRAVLDAVRQNASPTFSRLELPSEREAPHAVGAAETRKIDPTLLTEPPPGEDPYEWRTSEILRLIPEFERAVDRSDAASAAQLLAQVAAIESVDSRFHDALGMCRSRFAELYYATVELQPPPKVSETRGGNRDQNAAFSSPSPEPPTTPKYCRLCGASNRSAAVHCISCGAQFTDFDPGKTIARTEAQEPPPATPEPDRPAPGPKPLREETWLSGQRTELSMPVQEPPPVPTPAPKPRPAGDWWRQKPEMIGGAVLLLVVLAGVLFWVLRPIPPELAAGTAAVLSQQAIVYRDVNGGSPIVTLSKGARVNVLKLPVDLNQQWVPAQFVTAKKVYRAGFMQIHDVDPESWDAGEPGKNLNLIRIFHPGENGTEAELRTEIDALQRLTAGFPGTPASFSALLETAKLEFALARRVKDNGQPPEAWKPFWDSARAHAAAASGGDSSLSAEAQSLQARMDELAATSAQKPTRPPPPPTTRTPPPPSGIRDKLAEAQLALKAGGDSATQLANVKRAEGLVNEVLRSQPGNTEAGGLLNIIKTKKEFLEPLQNK